MTDYTELVARLSEMCCNIDDEAAAAIEHLMTDIEGLRGALDFCGSLASEELSYHEVGTAAEVVLRHISKRACAALSEQKP